MKVFDCVKAIVSSEFLNCAPTSIKGIQLMEDLAVKVKLKFELDHESPTFLGSIESILEAQKCLAAYLSEWLKRGGKVSSGDKDVGLHSYSSSNIATDLHVMVTSKNESEKSNSNSQTKDLVECQAFIKETKNKLNDNVCLSDVKLGDHIISKSHDLPKEGNDQHLKSDGLDKLCRLLQLDEGGQKRELFDRKRRYEENLPFKYCSLCSFKTKRQSHFVKHAMLHQKVSELHECEECGYRALRASTLRRHQLVHCASELCCPHCLFKTYNSEALVKHLNSKHPPNGCNAINEKYCEDLCQLQKPETHWQCQSCDYECTSNSRLRRHQNEVHSAKRPFMCDVCGYMFKRADTLQQHKTLHGGNSKYTCECGKQCRSMSHLLQHKSVHSNLRPYLCETCGVSFKTRSIQRKHQRKKHKDTLKAQEET